MLKLYCRNERVTAFFDAKFIHSNHDVKSENNIQVKYYVTISWMIFMLIKGLTNTFLKEII